MVISLICRRGNILHSLARKSSLTSSFCCQQSTNSAEQQAKTNFVNSPEISDEWLEKIDFVGSQSFASLLRRSKFVQLGDIRGRVVIGRIVRVFDDDLYVDFGCKFNAVMKRPNLDQERYTVGTLVRMRLHDVELSARFMGSNRDLTLLEADATLIGLYNRPKTVNIIHKTDDNDDVSTLLDLQTEKSKKHFKEGASKSVLQDLDL